MKCKYCKMQLIGAEETYGLCVDCQIAKEDAENLNELNRYREMFPVAPWSEEPITPEVCELYSMHGHDHGWGFIYTDGNVTVQFSSDDMRFVHVCSGGCGEQPWCKTAGQLACLVAARKTDEKH